MSDYRHSNTEVAPTVKDVARAVAELNDAHSESVWHSSRGLPLPDAERLPTAIKRVANNLAYHRGRYDAWGASKWTKRDTVAALIASGGDRETIGAHARAIGKIIRHDGSNGHA